MERIFFIIGCASGALAVVAGAFGGHLLEQQLEADQLEVFRTGVRYHLVHALALLATAWAQSRWPGLMVQSAGWCFVGGILLFSGSLYVLSLTGLRWLGMITPAGGLAFIAGWGLLGIGVYFGT